MQAEITDSGLYTHVGNVVALLQQVHVALVTLYYKYFHHQQKCMKTFLIVQACRLDFDDAPCMIAKAHDCQKESGGQP